MDEATPNQDRRDILNWFLGTSVGALLVAILYPIARFVSPPDIPEASTNQVEAGPTNDPELLAKGYKIVRFGAEPVIVIRLADSDFRAFAATCTHLDCIVEFHQKEQRLWCNCHSGAYDVAGKQTAGPPPRPLEPFKVDLISNGRDRPATIVVSRA